MILIRVCVGITFTIDQNIDLRAPGVGVFGIPLELRRGQRLTVASGTFQRRIECSQFRTLFVEFDVPETVLDIKCAEFFGTAEVWQDIFNGG